MILLNLCNEEDFERAKRIIQDTVGGNAGDGVVCFCVDPPLQIVHPQDLLRHPPQQISGARQQNANRSALILVDELRTCTRRLDIRFLACNLPKHVCDDLLQVARRESAKCDPKFKLSILEPGDRFPLAAEVDKVISNPPIKSAASPPQRVIPAKSIAPMQSAISTLRVAPVQSVTPTQRVTPSPTYSTPPSNKQAVTPNQAPPKTLPADLLKLQSDYEALLRARIALAKLQSSKHVLINTEREQLEQVEHCCAQEFPNQSLGDVVRELNEKRQDLENFERLLQPKDAPPTAEQDLWIKSRNDARGKIISLSQPLLTLARICAENEELKQNVEHDRLAARQCIDAIQTQPQSQPPANSLSLLWGMLMHYLYLFACAILARFGYSPHKEPMGLVRTVAMHNMKFDDEKVKKLQYTLSKRLSHKQFQKAKQCLRQLILLCQFNDEQEFASLLDIAEEECNKLVEYRSLLSSADTEDFLHHQELARELVHAHELLGQIPELKRAWLAAYHVDPNDAKCKLVYDEYLGITAKVLKIAHCAFPELMNRPWSEWESVTEVGHIEEDVDDFRSTLEKNDALLTEELSEYVLEDLPERMLVTLHGVKSDRVFGAASETNDDLYVFKRFVRSSNNMNASVMEIKHMRAALEMSRRIRHPSILRCLGGLLIDNNHACLQFPYMLGGDLEQWCKESARSFSHKLNALCGLIGAITELHKNDIVHRNIKPSNVVLDCNGVPKLTGFDLAVKLGTATVPRLNTKSIFTAPDAMQDQNAARVKSQDLYSFAATCVAVLGFNCVLPVVACEPMAMLHIKQDLFRQDLFPQEFYTVMGYCLSDKHKSRPETNHVYRVLTLRTCEIGNCCAKKDLFYCQGVTCLQGMHFYCEADFDAYVNNECGKPLAERNAEGKIHCFQCEDASKAFPTTALHKHMELINQSNAELIKAKANMEAEHKVRLMREEDRKLGVVASHCRHIAEEILTARCKVCHAAFVDFTGCCALTCTCGAHFCAFCFQVDANSAQSHEHVMQCNENPARGRYFADKEQYQAQQRTRKAQLLRNFLNELPPDQRQQVRRDGMVAENMREFGLA